MDTKHYSDLITPKNKLKFTVREDMLRESLSFHLESIRSQKINNGKRSNSIRDFAILTLKRNDIVQKRKMPYEIVKEFMLTGCKVLTNALG